MPWEFGDFVNADTPVVWCQSKEAMMAWWWWSAIKQQENSTGVENSALAAMTMARSGRKCANICPSVIQKSQSCALGLNFGRCVYSWLYIDFVMYTQGSSVTWVVVVVDDGFRRYIFEWKCCAPADGLLCVLTYYRAGRRMPEYLPSTELLLEHIGLTSVRAVSWENGTNRKSTVWQLH